MDVASNVEQGHLHLIMAKKLNFIIAHLNRSNAAFSALQAQNYKSKLFEYFSITLTGQMVWGVGGMLRL